MEYENLKEIEKRPKRYWSEDGLPDLVVGVLLFLIGAAAILPSLLPKNWHEIYWNVIWWFFLVECFLADWVIRKLKQHLTFPRTGYVEVREPGPVVRTVIVLLGAGIGAGLVLLKRCGQAWGINDLMALGAALLFALAFLGMSLWYKRQYYLWLSGLSLILAGIIVRAHPTRNNGFGLLFICLGLLWSLLGYLRLREYLRRNPLPQEGEA